MASPVKAKAWTISACNRIAYVSLIDTMQNYLFGVVAFLIARGYTVKFSASGGVGPANAADATNRWINAAAVTPRATIAAASQAWIVLVDGNGAQILITFQGASDDIARIAFSPGALYTLAGTTNQQPTATDEQVISSTVSLIDATASADRLWSGWADSTHKMCRFAIARAGSWVGRMWGVELFTPASIVAPASIPVPAIGWSYPSTATTTPPNATATNGQGLIRSLVSGVGISCIVGGGFEAPIANANASNFTAVNCELQGSLGPPIFQLSLWSLTAGSRGKVGNRIDWWHSTDQQVPGQTTVGKDFIHMSNLVATANPGWLWPWDSATTPVMS